MNTNPTQFDWLSAIFESPRAHVKPSEYQALSVPETDPPVYLDESEIRWERYVESDEDVMRREDNYLRAQEMRR